jgi:hypothetical protein
MVQRSMFRVQEIHKMRFSIRLKLILFSYCRFVIGKTHVLVGVKASLGEPLPTAPDSGIVKVSVEWCVYFVSHFVDKFGIQTIF